MAKDKPGEWEWLNICKVNARGAVPPLKGVEIGRLRPQRRLAEIRAENVFSFATPGYSISRTSSVQKFKDAVEITNTHQSKSLKMQRSLIFSELSNDIKLFIKKRVSRHWRIKMSLFTA